MATGEIAVRRDYRSLAWVGLAAFRPLHALIAAPALVFFATLAAMLFRPPDLHFYALDRIALALLVAVVGLRALVLREIFTITAPVALPLFALISLNLFELLSRPSEEQDWSTFAAKWAVPFLLFHIAQLVFLNKKSLRQFEIFLLVVLTYLSLMAILFLTEARSFIFPTYILDESIGIHADRARGPFLQAVANGVSLTLLSLIALDSYRRGRLHGFLAIALAVAAPVAVLATKTRSVWVSFAGAVVFLWVFSASRCIRQACGSLALAGIVLACGTCLACLRNASFGERLEERSPVEFRFSMYQAGWQMFQQRPLLGWPADSIQPELAKIVDGFHHDQFFFHNSYLEVAVKHGLLGLALYFWILVDLLRVGRKISQHDAGEAYFLDATFRPLWPVLVGVYLVNASFVVMNYQFVNGLLLTLAGILAAQNQRERIKFTVHQDLRRIAHA